MIYRKAPFLLTLNDPYPSFKVTPFFDPEYLRNGTRYRQFQWNTNKDLHTPYNDMMHRAVSLRQLSFLLLKKYDDYGDDDDDDDDDVVWSSSCYKRQVALLPLQLYPRHSRVR